MSDSLLALLPLFGAPVLGIATLLSCLAVPIPTSLMMMAAGGLAAAGDLSLWATLVFAYLGALMGDQAGFWLGRSRSSFVTRLETKDTRQARALSRATGLTRSHGIWAVFLSRWLLSPLGPYVNFAAGAAKLNWRAFSLGSVIGEAIWVSLYLSLGAAGGQTLTVLWPMISDVLGILAALAVAGLLLVRLRHLMRLHDTEVTKRRRRSKQPRPQNRT